ncbi:hypothetical protein ET445_08265 [Agromyces protaetiae]|uniref:Uncharacterized protein n=1 Tax=Agromyces protaetiae TaxID=2509455 RepID=A0A4P6FFY2_9MICO|nr:hypothetical protein [Agromyces protaetiae]QAY73339.1 hypothetical protein ET445_08265 [Agromyces protaetiae]
MPDLSRRGFLQANLATVFAAILAERGLSAAEAERLALPGAAFGPAATATPDPMWDGSTTTGPYTLNASSAMSQDYFLTDDVVLDTEASLVAPFEHADGSIAAIVVNSGNISILQRDATAPTGWSLTTSLSLDSDDGDSYYPPASLVAAGRGADGNIYGLLFLGTGPRAAPRRAPGCFRSSGTRRGPSRPRSSR